LLEQRGAAVGYASVTLDFATLVVPEKTRF
jgi:hypothetical protein